MHGIKIERYDQYNENYFTIIGGCPHISYRTYECCSYQLFEGFRWYRRNSFCRGRKFSGYHRQCSDGQQQRHVSTCLEYFFVKGIYHSLFDGRKFRNGVPTHRQFYGNGDLYSNHGITGNYDLQ